MTILANATFAHDDLIHYMVADGWVHELNRRELIAEGLLLQKDFDLVLVPVGMDSPIEQLRSVH